MLDNRINQLKTTEKHNGKMKGMQSLSTSALCNEQCIQNKQDPESICNKCYALSMLLQYSNLTKMLESNYAILTSSILPINELPATNVRYFRFEAFGDIANEIHFINYINMCVKNPHTQFAIWSKNPHIIDTVLNDMHYEKPHNLEIVISSLYLNVAFNIDAMPYKKRYWFVDKIFTVYTADYAIKHNIPVNCGNKKCIECRLCYDPQEKGIMYINEIVKNEQKRYYDTMAALKDYTMWRQENELNHNENTLEMYITGLYYDLCDSYNGKDTSEKARNKWIKKQEKKIENTIKKYYK